MDGTSEKIAQINALLTGHSNALRNKEVSGYSVDKILEAANKIAEVIIHDQQKYLDASIQQQMDKKTANAEVPITHEPLS